MARKSKYQKTTFRSHFCKSGIRQEKELSERRTEMEIIGIILFCAAVLACAKMVLDPPERPKDPEEDREQLEYLREWKEKHKK